MKSKFFIVFLCALLIMTVFSLTACTEEPEDQPTLSTTTDVTVFSDIHVLSSDQFGDTLTPGLQRIVNVNEKVIGLSEAIFRTAIDDFIASDSPVLILTGDLTDDGAKVAHQAVGRELKRAEDAGKRCYVINGNHDINNGATSYKEEEKQDIDSVTPEQFEEIYRDFGFSEALSRDDNSLSYTAELSDKYRLIAWDIAKYDVVPGTVRSVEHRHDPYVTTERLNWLDMQLKLCYLDGKTPFLITHFPILSHIGPLVGSMSHVNRQSDVLNVLYRQQSPVPFSFCGHVHQQDIASYAYPDNENYYYEIETGSLSYTTLPKRHFVDVEGAVTITTMQQSYVNAAYIPAFYSDEERARILADLPSYVWEYENESFSKYMYGKLYLDDICALLGVTDLDAVDRAQEIVDAFYYMPLYEKDANGGKSLEAICVKNGVTDFPVITDGKTVGEFLATLIKNNFAGDEKWDKDSERAKMLRYALYAALDQIAESKIFQYFGYLEEKTNGEDVANIRNLFATGKLEIVQSDILQILTHVPAVNKVDLIRRLISGSSESIAEKLAPLLENIDTLIQIVPEGKIRDLLFEIYNSEEGFASVIDLPLTETKEGYLNVGGIVDIVYSIIGEGLLWDDGANDNEFSFLISVPVVETDE